ncbi:MAG: HoxN/HupN/NixA family nickel/cobalt transporter, partial [Actinocrinis sp.]
MSVPENVSPTASAVAPNPSAASAAGGGSLAWRRSDTYRVAGLGSVILLMHVAAFGVLALLVAPNHYTVGKQVFGFGLGITAYTLG